MSSPLDEFEPLRRSADAAPAEDSRPMSTLEGSNLIQQVIRKKRDLCVTPFGVLTDPEPFERLKQRAENAIQRCKIHAPPSCQCWADARIRLWNVRKQFPERSAEAWTAVRIWTELEGTERGK